MPRRLDVGIADLWRLHHFHAIIIQVVELYNILSISELMHVRDRVGELFHLRLGGRLGLSSSVRLNSRGRYGP